MSAFYRLSSLGLGVASADGIIKRPDAEAMSSADLVLAESQRAAETTRSEAQAVYESEKQRGYADGLAEAARENAARLLQENLQLDTHLAQLEVDLARLVTRATQQIISRFDDAQLAREVTRTALQTMRTEKRIRLHVAPEAEQSLKIDLAAMRIDYPEIELIDLVVESRLTAPNLEIESEMGVIKFTLEEGLAQLGAILRGGPDVAG